MAASGLGIDNVSPFTTPALSTATSALLLGAFAPGFPEERVTIAPANGFTTVIDELRGEGAWVASVARRTVSAGTYDAAWTLADGVDDFDFGVHLLVFKNGPIDAPVIGASAKGRYEESDNTARTAPVTTQTATNLVVYVHGEGGNPGFPTITDSYNNTWVPQGVQQTSEWPGFLWVFTSLNAAGGANHTITTTKPFGYQTILAVEVLGSNVAIASSQLAVDNVGPFTAPAVSSTTGALLLGAFAPGFPEDTVTITPLNGFTTIVEEPQGEGAWVASVAARTVSPGIYEAGWSMTGGVNDFDFAVHMLVLKNAP